MPAPEVLQHTPLDERHRKLGAKMVPFAGYAMPLQYAGLVAEHRAVRSNAGLFDVCHMGEIRVTGQRSLHFVNSLVTSDLGGIAVNQALYTCACRESGGIIDDLILYKVSDNNVLIVCNASNRSKLFQHLEEQAQDQEQIHLADESDATGLIALQGPKAFSILSIANPELEGLASTLKPFHFCQTVLGGASVTLARTGYTGEDGVEAFCSSAEAPQVWDALMNAGRPLGLLPAGLGCRDTLRLEARLSLYGNELNEATNPLEAGLAWTVKFDKGDFLGRASLLTLKETGLARRIAGFEVLGRGSARAGYDLLDLAGTAVGKCTSGGPSPTLGRPIGLGYLPLPMAKIGTEFLVNARGKQLLAKVVKTPFYRRPNHQGLPPLVKSPQAG